MKKASKTLTDKQIRELQIKEKKYIRTVGNSKELIITINPSGIKVFSLRVNGKYYKLKEFNDKVYPVEYARKEAISILNEMNQKNITLDKYKEVATSHGFRATFRTICTLYSDKITKLGISDKVVEECLSHKEDNKVIASYDRQRATLEQKRILI